MPFAGFRGVSIRSVKSAVVLESREEASSCWEEVGSCALTKTGKGWELPLHVFVGGGGGAEQELLEGVWAETDGQGGIMKGATCLFKA